MEYNSKEYKVVKAKVPYKNEVVDRWIITENKIPMYEVCEFLDFMSINSINTGKTYANALLKYFRYLDTINIEYDKVEDFKTIRKYVIYRLYGTDFKKVKSIEPKKAFYTIAQEISIIGRFYRWLEDNRKGFKNPIPVEKTKNDRNKNLTKKFLYGQIWEGESREKIIKNLKYKSNRKYKKWYTEEEKEALIANFLTIRDKVIFLISIEGGCRIDEILNLKYYNYDNLERTIYIDTSKTFDRHIVLPQYVCDEIDRYIMTERQEVEAKVGVSEWLFLNMREGKHIGKKLTYRNYYEILKRCAKRAGLNPEEIITHAGRSTRVQELIEHQALYPEDGITDAIIMEIFGWSSIDSIKPYKRNFSAKLQKNTIDKICERKRKD